MEEINVFNIGAISRMTGIPIATLHAWERRYGFPRSTRTPGGHRLYSEQDVLQLRAVKGYIEQGLSTHLAVAAVQKMRQAAPEGLPRAIQSPSNTLIIPTKMQEQLQQALFNHDLEMADRILGQSQAFFTPEELIVELIDPVMHYLGEAWQQGKISIATEHLASNYLRHRILAWMGAAPRAGISSPIVLACPPGEWHEGGLLMLGVLLRRKGWPVVYLGQNTPFADLAGFVKQTQPGAIVLAAMSEESARAIAEWPNWITQSSGKPIVAFGGRAFDLPLTLQESVPGFYLGATIQEGIQKLVGLLQQPE